MLLVGIFSALGLLLIALKLGGRKTIGADVFVDVLITITLLVCFYGTFSGTSAAMIGGLVVSVVLFVMKKTMKHEKLTLAKTKIGRGKVNFSRPSLKWKEVEPTWRAK